MSGKDAHGASPPQSASESFPVESRVTVGIEGVYKNGFWTPITVKTEKATKGLEIETLDSDGVPVVSRQICSGEQTTVYLPLGRAKAPLTLREKDDGGKRVREEVLFPREGARENYGKSDSVRFVSPVASQRPIYLLLGDDNIGLTEALGELRLKEDQRPMVHSVRDFSSLPDQVLGYEAVELIILATAQPDFWKGVTRSDPRIQALERWTRLGGRVLLLAGRNSLPLISESGPLSGFVPGRPDPALHEIRIANSIVRYVPKSKNLVMTGSRESPFLESPLLRDLDQDVRVELMEMETPLLVRAPFGFGTVTWFAADLSQSPLSRWGGRSGLIIRLLGFDPEKSKTARAESLLVQRGFSDLSGQVRSTLDSFADVWNIPFSLILLLIALYTLLIGPGDWYLTHRLLRCPNLTWLTLPMWLLLFTFLAITLGRRAHPEDLRINRVDLVDFDSKSGLVRGTSWNGLYSPKDARYDLSLTVRDGKQWNPDASSQTLSWLGLQGSGLGGMEPKTVSVTLWETPYEQASPDKKKLRAMPIAVRSSKSLLGRWSGTTKGLSFGELSSFDGVPTGKIENPFGLPLQNAILFYGRWAIDLGTLPPEGYELSIKTPKMERHLVLGTTEDPFRETTRSVVNKGLSRYDTRSTSLPYILRTMMFYRLAGGADFIGLDNSYQHYVDMSDLLVTGRAVLVGTLNEARRANPKKDEKISDPNSTRWTGFPYRSELLLSDSSAAEGGESTAVVALKNQTVLVRIVLPVTKK